MQCTRKRARRSERGASALAPGPLPACRGDSPRRKCGPWTCRKSTAALVQQEVEVFLPSPVSRRARVSSAEELELQNRPQSATSGPQEQVLGCQEHALPGRSCVVQVRGKEQGCMPCTVVRAGLTWWCYLLSWVLQQCPLKCACERIMKKGLRPSQASRCGSAAAFAGHEQGLGRLNLERRRAGGRQQPG